MDEFMADVVKLGEYVGTLSGSHAYVKGHLERDGLLDTESPVVQAFLAGMGSKGERPKNKTFRSGLKKYGIEFETVKDGTKEKCYSCWGNGDRSVWKQGSYVNIPCQCCKGTGELDVAYYEASYNGRKINHAD